MWFGLFIMVAIVLGGVLWTVWALKKGKEEEKDKID
jgi:hypothetical protein